jgi:hypothetical protein
MSMTSHFVEIKPELLKQLQQEPILLVTIVYPELSDRGSPSDSDADAMIRAWTPARQQYFRAVQSADADAIVAALKKLVPRKQWQVMRTHIHSMTKEQLSRQAVESRERLVNVSRGYRSILKQVAQEKAGAGRFGRRSWRCIASQGLGGLTPGFAGRWVPVGSRGLAVLGGTEIGDDHGYGPARYLSASRVSYCRGFVDSYAKRCDNIDTAAMNGHSTWSMG